MSEYPKYKIVPCISFGDGNVAYAVLAQEKKGAKYQNCVKRKGLPVYFSLREDAEAKLKKLSKRSNTPKEYA